MEILPFERVIQHREKKACRLFPNVRMLAVEIVEEKRYMVQGSEKKKTVIDVTSIQKRFEKGRAVVKP